MSYYLHDLPPFLFRYQGGRSEAFTARWDALAYLAGFTLALLWLKRSAARGALKLPSGEVFDFTSTVALLGALLGGRLGYLLVNERERFLGNLGLLLQLGQRGMSFPGCVLGVALVTAVLAYQKRLSWLHLGDHLVVMAPLGLLLGGLAHFMEGEPLGRVTRVPWAVLFPAEVHLTSFQPAQLTRLDLERLPWSSFDIMQVAHAAPRILDDLRLMLNPRHPLPLYEALLEGLLLFILLAIVRTRARPAPEGVLSGLFLLLYAVFHFGLGFLREPLDGDPMRWGLTQDQLLTLPLLGLGLALLGWSLSHRPQTASDLARKIVPSRGVS